MTESLSSHGGEGLNSALADVENALRIIQIQRRRLIRNGYSRTILSGAQGALELALSQLADSKDGSYWKDDE